MAARYFVNGGVNNDWGDTSNWSTTSGSAGGSTVPTSADDANLDANSPSCTINASNRTVNSLVTTGYTNTLTFTFNLTVFGLTLSATTTLAGTATLIVDGSGSNSITTNGKVINIPLTLGVSGSNRTFTLNDALNVSGLLTVGPASFGLNTTLNTSALNIMGDAVFNHTGGLILGTSAINFTGTGTVSMPTLTATGKFNNAVTINTAGTLTISGLLRFGANFTYTAGTVVTTGSTLDFNATSTLALSGVTWNNLTFSSNSATYTLSNAVTLSGTLTLSSGGSSQVFNGFSITCGGSLVSGIINGFITGTTTLLLNGTGTISGYQQTFGAIRLALEINTAGAYAFTSQFNYDTGLLKFTAGTITGTGSLLLIQSTTTVTVNSPTVSLGTIACPVATTMTWNGSYGFTCENYFCRPNSTGTHIFQSGNTYVITGLLFSEPQPGNNPLTLRSSTASSPAYLNFTGIAPLVFASVIQDISSSGVACYAMNSTLTRTVGWTNETTMRVPSAGGGGSAGLRLPVGFNGGFRG